MSICFVIYYFDIDRLNYVDEYRRIQIEFRDVPNLVFYAYLTQIDMKVTQFRAFRYMEKDLLEMMYFIFKFISFFMKTPEKMNLKSLYRSLKNRIDKTSNRVGN